MRYRTADAFRMALEGRINQLHPRDSFRIQRSRKRVAFERFLARLQAPPASRWFLKGAFALELRFGDRARATRDVDLGVDLALLSEADHSEEQFARSLRAAAEHSLGDYFVYRIPIDREGPLPFPDVRAYRFGVQASVADRPFEDFNVDVGVGMSMVTPTDEISESDTLAFAGITPRRFRVISLPQHFAEKVHAFTRQWDERENTRVKDLVDITLMLEGTPPDREATRLALQRVFGSRGSQPLPTQIPDPPVSWMETYSRAATVINLSCTNIDGAMGIFRAYWSELFR